MGNIGWIKGMYSEYIVVNCKKKLDVINILDIVIWFFNCNVVLISFFCGRGGGVYMVMLDVKCFIIFKIFVICFIIIFLCNRVVDLDNKIKIRCVLCDVWIFIWNINMLNKI